MASVLNFSTKPATRSLQETAVNYSQIGDAELLSYLSSLIEENSFPASLAMFVVKLCSQQRRRNLFSQFVRMLRKHKYTRPSVYLKECTWVWSTGWRERGFAMVLEGTIKWRSLNYLALLKAFYVALTNETPQDLSSRHLRIKSMPEANRPFLEGETYVNENRDIIRFHQIMENFNKIDVAFLANPRGKICEGVLGLHFDAFL